MPFCLLLGSVCKNVILFISDVLSIYALLFICMLVPLACTICFHRLATNPSV